MTLLAAFALLIPSTALGKEVEPRDYKFELLTSDLDQPLLVTAPVGDSRSFVVEKAGVVRIIEDGRLRSGEFINLSNLVRSSGSEQGLLGMAFHPQFPSNGRFFLSYTDTSGATVVAEFHADPSANRADPSPVQTIIRVSQPYSNHNGGHIQFGPDGYLYVGLGDGGSGGDPRGHGQNHTTLLGSILRIDPDADDFPSNASRNYGIPNENPFVGSTGADEIWLYGVRNPWRFWIDADSDLIYVADVGQSAREEVTVLPVDAGGVNLGWNRLEGSRCYPSGGSCSTSGTVLPDVEYGHSMGSSITGGVVYRGTEMPELTGTYFYGDFITAFVSSFFHDGVRIAGHTSWSAANPGFSLLSSFGVDGFGELYVVSLSGSLWRLKGQFAAAQIGDFDGVNGADIAIQRSGDWLVSQPSPSGGSDFSRWADYRTPAGWQSQRTGDFNGDGRDDIANYHPSTGNWVVSQSTGSSFTNRVWTTFSTKTGWTENLVGDFDGDGRDDIANYHPSTGNWVVSESRGSSFRNRVWTTFSTKTGWTQNLIGDFNGDGRDDIANYHPTTGNWVVSESNGDSFRNRVWND